MNKLHDYNKIGMQILFDKFCITKISLTLMKLMQLPKLTTQIPNTKSPLLFD